MLDTGPTLAPDGIRGYLDGALFGSGPAAIVDRHLGNVSLGALDQSTLFHDGPSGHVPGFAPYAGWIDDVRICHRALTDTEITTLGASPR